MIQVRRHVQEKVAPGKMWAKKTSTGNLPTLLSCLTDLPCSGGGTALYDAIAQALDKVWLPVRGYYDSILGQVVCVDD